jgi:hypothetical protein
MCGDDFLNLLEQLDDGLCDVLTYFLQEVRYNNHHEQRKQSKWDYEHISDIVTDLSVHRLNFFRNHLSWDNQHERVVLFLSDLIVK